MATKEEINTMLSKGNNFEQMTNAKLMAIAVLLIDIRDLLEKQVNQTNKQ